MLSNAMMIFALHPLFSLLSFQEPSSNTVDFATLNDTKENAGTPHVRATGKLPLELEITDTREKPDRKLRVLVTVFEKPDPTRNKAGKFVKDFLHPKTLTAKDVGAVKTKVESEIKLPKGDYVYYVFCN